MKPFFEALTAKALIRYYTQVSADSAILTKIQTSMDNIWNYCFDDATGKVYYVCSINPPHNQGISGEDPNNPPPPTPTPLANTQLTADLNLLISPVFSWLYSVTGDQKYRYQSDRIWNGGITVTDPSAGCGFHCINGGAYIASSKDFNQNYTFSFQGLTWRGLMPNTPTPTATNTPNPTLAVKVYGRLTGVGR
jgi:hypothetical protein